MKKIPFDLERAKKGEAFRVSPRDQHDNFYIMHNDEFISLRYKSGFDNIYECCLMTDTKRWHHLIPDEPKSERWAVVYNMDIHNSKQEAEFHRNGSTNHTVFKLADDED